MEYSDQKWHRRPELRLIGRLVRLKDCLSSWPGELWNRNNAFYSQPVSSHFFWLKKWKLSDYVVVEVAVVYVLLPRFISMNYYPSLCLCYYLFVHLFNTLSLIYLYSFVPFTNYGWDFYITMYLQFQILLLTSFVRAAYFPISQACNSFTLVYIDNHSTFELTLNHFDAK